MLNSKTTQINIDYSFICSLFIW